MSDLWCASRVHRQIVTQSLFDSAPKARGSLCLLGAGECNDVTLGLLSEVYEQVLLVDNDREALNRALLRHGVSPWRTATVDLFGLDLLSDNPARYARKHVKRVAGALRPHRDGAFSTVASLCLLSQGIDQLSQMGRLDLGRLVLLRKAHLELLLTLREGAGVCWLFTDVVSSETVDGLGDYSTDALRKLLSTLAASRNHFHGLHPATVLEALREVCEPHQVAIRGPVGPWVWNMGERQYLIVGFQVCPAS